MEAGPAGDVREKNSCDHMKTCCLAEMSSTWIFLMLLPATLMILLVGPARAQPLRLMSMWRHVGEDGFAMSPCSDAGELSDTLSYRIIVH